jgi:hypothetical protein
MVDVALKEYLEEKIRALDQRMCERFALNDLSSSKSDATLQHRLNSMNEFREALKDQAARMATRVELEHLAVMVRDLENRRANLDGRLYVVAIILSIAASGLTAVFIQMSG